MVRTHKLKILEDFADAVYNGDKTFEIRENDRGFQKGDNVIFSVIDKDDTHITHPIENYVYEITYVLANYNIDYDYVMFGIKKIDKKVICYFCNRFEFYNDEESKFEIRIIKLDSQHKLIFGDKYKRNIEGSMDINYCPICGRKL